MNDGIRATNRSVIGTALTGCNHIKQERAAPLDRSSGQFTSALKDIFSAALPRNLRVVERSLTAAIA